ncbi:unnamed protein product [marine sediment metagenome]|uniref:adenosylhomocysteine nucleosidase n=1 Tax=marine sediment metagenome TaxID=412755 RepID=X1AR35_9ZZZZ
MVSIITKTIGNRVYYSGDLHGIETVIVFSKIGKVAAAITAMILLNQFEIDAVIFTGVAGSVVKDLNVGDIVIGDQLYQHDMNASPVFKQHEIPLTGITFFKSHSELFTQAKKAAEKFILQDINKYILQQYLQEFSIINPKVQAGKIATGDQFINDLKQMCIIKETMPDVLAVEMEGASVAQVCFEHNVPFIVIRTISDNIYNIKLNLICKNMFYCLLYIKNITTQKDGERSGAIFLSCYL